MLKIEKYYISDIVKGTASALLPSKAKILHVNIDERGIYILAAVDTGSAVETRHFYWVKIEDRLIDADIEKLNYIGTCGTGYLIEKLK